MIWKPVSYIMAGIKKGFSHDAVHNAAKFYDSFSKKNIPCLLTLKHLAKKVNLPFKAVYKLTYNQTSNYKKFFIRKRSGGFRVIYSPCATLLKIQQWINIQILQKDSSISSDCFSFRKGFSIKDCAFVHCNCRWLIKIDIKNYFESISEIDIYNYFHKLGYPKLISFHLARICTVVDVNKSKSKYWHSFQNNNYKFLTQNEIGFLPQGAATSPMLANLISLKIDEEINQLLSSFNIKFNYSRYADDIFISSKDMNCDINLVRKILNNVYSILYKNNFSPNLQKTKIIKPGKNKTVLGLNVNSDVPKLSKNFKNKLECHLYYFNKDKIYHSHFRAFNSILGASAYIKGLLSYANLIDSEYVNKLKNKIGLDENVFVI